MQVVDPRPGILRSTGHEPASLVVHGNAGDLVLEVHLLEQATGGGTVEEIHALAGGHANDPGVVGLRREAVELAAADGAFDGVLDNRLPRAEIPPSDLSILSRGREDVVVFVPDDGLDRAPVDPWTDLIARRGSRRA